MASTKDVDQLLRSIAHIDGVEVRSNGKPHHHVFFKGRLVTTLPKTPSDSRWYQNAVTTLRRAGITPSNKPQVRGARSPRGQDDEPRRTASSSEVVPEHGLRSLPRERRSGG